MNIGDRMNSCISAATCQAVARHISSTVSKLFMKSMLYHQVDWQVAESGDCHMGPCEKCTSSLNDTNVTRYSSGAKRRNRLT